MSRSGDTCAVIVAGGTGERFGDPRGKQFVPIAGLPMLAWSLLAFDACDSVASAVVVCAPDRFDEVRKGVLGRVDLSLPVCLAASGAVRQASCLSGLRATPADAPFVAIHDAARPLVLPADVERVLARVRDDASLDGALLARPAVDTLKVAPAGIVRETPDRSEYWYAQTPQAFRRGAIVAAHERAASDGFVGTDDCSLVERLGGRVACVAPTAENLKVTMPDDLAVAEAVLDGRGAAAPGRSLR